MVTPSVGDVVLFRLDQKVQRPLLVVSVSEKEEVAGEVFLDWAEDRQTAWCLEHCFFLPAAGSRQLEVRQVRFGRAIGEWQWRKK